MNNKGISPVIATVIIVAVAIAVSIAVAFWMTGIVGLFTGFEQVQITSAYATKDNNGVFTIHLKLKNTGTSDATIDGVFINGKPFDEVSSTTTITVSIDNSAFTSSDFQKTIGAGSTVNAKIIIGAGIFSSGQSIEVKIHTASGKEYPKLVVLP